MTAAGVPATDDSGWEARCSGEGCWYTLPVVDGLIVSHSAPMTLDNCEGSRRPPLSVQEPTPARPGTADELREEIARWLWERYGSGSLMELRGCQADADDLLAGPLPAARRPGAAAPTRTAGRRMTTSRRRSSRPWAVATMPEARWRVGRSYGIHVYEVSPSSPDGDRPVATFHRAEDAAQAVADRDTLARVAALAEEWTRYPQSPEERERNRYGAAMEDCGKALREIVGGAS